MTQPSTDPGLLTAEEHAAIEAAGALWNQLCEIVGRGPTRQGDLHELAFHVHGIQRAVMKQAAARAYPDRYRLLGALQDALYPAMFVGVDQLTAEIPRGGEKT